MDVFLSRIEIIQLTGYKSCKCQANWLAENGFSFDVRSDGLPIVLREQLVERQCKRPVKKSMGPDLSWID